MARLKELAIKVAGDQLLFDPEKIMEEAGTNYRDMESEDTKAHIRKMVDSIHAGGTDKFPAITVYQKDGNVYVRAGWCRRRAHVLAANEGAPVKGIRAISGEMKEAEAVLDVLNSNDGLPLKPLEQAKAYHRLITFQWTVSEIARRRGISAQAVSNMLALLDAPAPVVEMVEKGEVSATLAVETVRSQGALMGTDALQTGVKAAKEKGKTHATKKDMPKPAVKSTRITPEPEKSEINWNNYGPQLEAVLNSVLTHFKREGIQHHDVVNARALLKEIRYLKQ